MRELHTGFAIPGITFVIFTFNEAPRLPNVIKNFRRYGRILVVDNFSTDETIAIARAAGCDVLLNKNTGWVEDFETTERVKTAVQTPWIYWAFADEILTEDVLAEIKEVVEANQFDVVTILRKNYFYGQFCHEVAATYQTKAFKKAAIDFRNNTIHNFGQIMVPDKRVYRMPPSKFIHHLITNTIDSYLGTINRYTNMEAESKPASELDKPLSYYLSLPLKTIYHDFFLRGSIRVGQAGVSLSLLMMIYSLVRAMKGYERKYGINAETIRHRDAALAANLLESFE